MHAAAAACAGAAFKAAGLAKLILFMGVRGRDALFVPDPVHPSHVGAKYLRNDDAAIWLLIIFKNGHQRAAYRKPGAIQCMDKVGLGVFLSSGRAVFDACTPGLK